MPKNGRWLLYRTCTETVPQSSGFDAANGLPQKLTFVAFAWCVVAQISAVLRDSEDVRAVLELGRDRARRRICEHRSRIDGRWNNG